VAAYHKVGKIDCSNYRGTSPLSISYKVLSNTFLSRLSPYVDEVIWELQCSFLCNRSTADQIVCIHQALESIGYNETVHLLFTTSLKPLIQL
jgi:hypothetical protein